MGCPILSLKRSFEGLCLILAGITVPSRTLGGEVGVGGIKNMEWPQLGFLVGEDIDTASNMAMGGVRLRFPNNTLFGCTGTHVHHPGTPW